MSSPCNCEPSVGSGRAAAAAFLKTAYVSEMTVRYSSVLESHPTLPRDTGRGRKVSAPGSFCLHGRWKGSGRTALPDPWVLLQLGQGHFPPERRGPSWGQCAGSADTRRPSLLLNLGHGKWAPRHGSHQNGSCPPQLLVVLWAPRSEGGL